MKKINIVSKNNGVGLSRDYEIIDAILKERGHQTRFIDVYGSTFAHADINIFLELTDSRFLNVAKHNLMIPNPEWFYRKWDTLILKMDKIICKTADTYQIFAKRTPRVFYSSFTSQDQHIPEIQKQREFIHVAGKSSHKNTAEVYECWKRNQDLPVLHLLKQEKNEGYEPLHNLVIYKDPLTTRQLQELQNFCAFHLCPSEYEGFGHYIHEAKSCGGILITTDAAPMNEFAPRDCAILVKGNAVPKHNLGQCWKVTPDALAHACRTAMELTDEEIKTRGTRTREDFNDNDLFFRYQFTELIKEYE